MIQELLSGAGLIGERKISTNGAAGVLPLITTSHSSVSYSSHPSTPTTTTSTAAAASATSTNSENQNLRCPRCDSSNTKFCYYNNYNLTQPRHFCKTCRRYWTKGGALRNVPIGGGCRKNRNVCTSNSVVKTSVAKMKTAAPSELERSVLGLAGFIDQDLASTPILWGSPQNSHGLALLKAGQNHNPNPHSSLPISVNNVVKEERNLMVSNTVTEPVAGNGLVHGRALNFDSVGQFTTLGLCSSIWRSSNGDNNNQDGFVVGEHEGNGIHELYQRLRSSSSSANYYSDNNSSQVLGNTASSSHASSSLSANLGSTPVVSGDDQLGYTWNPTPSWFDLSTTNGTLYP